MIKKWPRTAKVTSLSLRPQGPTQVIIQVLQHLQQLQQLLFQVAMSFEDILKKKNSEKKLELDWPHYTTPERSKKNIKQEKFVKMQQQKLFPLQIIKKMVSTL